MLIPCAVTCSWRTFNCLHRTTHPQAGLPFQHEIVPGSARHVTTHCGVIRFCTMCVRLRGPLLTTSRKATFFLTVMFSILTHPAPYVLYPCFLLHLSLNNIPLRAYKHFKHFESAELLGANRAPLMTPKFQISVEMTFPPLLLHPDSK